jgi:CRP-like cAMP-binding protein
MTIDPIILAYVASEETYSDKETIIQEDSKNNWVYVIMEGRVKIQKKTPRGMVTLGTLKKGAVLGEMAFLTAGKGVRSVSAVATGGHVRVGLLDSQRLLRDYEAVPPRLKDLINLLIKRLQSANVRVCELVTKAS